MKINKVELLSRDLIETEKFYSDKLGLVPIKKSIGLLIYQIGPSKLVFHKGVIEKPIYHFAFNIPKNQLSQAERWLSSKLTPLKYDNNNIIDFKSWNAKSIYFLDNNDNVLELIARNDLDNESDIDFDFSKTTISEIGFVTDDVEQLANSIIYNYNLSYYQKQMPSSDFSVIGDDNGLIILVKKQRNWFPTQIGAEAFWIKVEIESPGSGVQSLEYKGGS